MKNLVLTLLITLLLESVASADVGQEHGSEEEHDGHDHAELPHTELSETMAIESGITTIHAGPGQVARKVRTFGRVTVPPGQISHIRARYEGLLKAVSVDVGDVVKAGELMATVESNDSLAIYSITAPISGVVTQRHANAGELASDQVLFSIVDASLLWVELQIFEKQTTEVSAGQAVLVSSETQQSLSNISRIVPNMDDNPYVVALVPLKNSGGHWSPGMLVEGDVMVQTLTLPLVVENKAIQTMAGQQGVFVNEGQRYEFRVLQLGASDRKFTEVKSGLRPGESYVNAMSFLIKADIEKSEAAHEH